MTNINDYNTPAAGTTDWHVPLNENFDWIADDVSALAAELDASVQADYNAPAEGSVDWHVPLNENFSAIEEDVQTLAAAAGVSDVGGYETPTEGSVDWHVPLNQNFTSIESDLSTIADAIGGNSPSLSGMKTLSKADVWLSLVASGADLSEVVYDATDYEGGTLAEQVENTLSQIDVEAGGKAIVWVPAGSYSWDRTVSFATGSVLGPTFLFDTDANVEVTTDWAFDFAPANRWGLVNDQRTAMRFFGGKWTLNGTGLVRGRDMYRGVFCPVSVTGGEHALEIYQGGGSEWSEGWTVRDAVFEGVDRPIRFETQSADQQLFANLTFKDFDKAIEIDASAQNISYTDLAFENPRRGAVGIHFHSYTTGTVYHPQWDSSTGTVFRFGDWAKPSVADAEVASGAEFSIVDNGSAAPRSSGVDWQQAHLSPIVTDGGPSLPDPFVRTDEFSGSLPDRVEAAVADLSDGGTVVIPGQDSYSWDRTVGFDLAGRDVNIVTPPNVWIDMDMSAWGLEVTGDGHFGIYGGYWKGNPGSSGWLRTDTPNIDVSPNEVRDFKGGTGIDATPRTKGTYRIYDLRFIHVVTGGTDQSSNACVQIGGAGCSELFMAHVEAEDTKQPYRLNSDIDDFHGMRLSCHPWHDDAVFAETNARVDGTWYNPKWEAPNRADNIVFDNSNTSSPAQVTEPWAWAADEPVELWRGTKPQILPDIGSRVKTKFQP